MTLEQTTDARLDTKTLEAAIIDAGHGLVVMTQVHRINIDRRVTTIRVPWPVENPTILVDDLRRLVSRLEIAIARNHDRQIKT